MRDNAYKKSAAVKCLRSQVAVSTKNLIFVRIVGSHKKRYAVDEENVGTDQAFPYTEEALLPVAGDAVK